MIPSQNLLNEFIHYQFDKVSSIFFRSQLKVVIHLENWNYPY
jgi:hypothetical protein